MTQPIKKSKRRKKTKQHIAFSKIAMSCLLIVSIIVTEQALWICEKHGIDPSNIINQIWIVVGIGLPSYLASSTIQKIDRNNRKGNIYTQADEVTERTDDEDNR